MNIWSRRNKVEKAILCENSLFLNSLGLFIFFCAKNNKLGGQFHTIYSMVKLKSSVLIARVIKTPA